MLDIEVIYSFGGGLGDRHQQVVDGVTTNYTLDLAAGLTQVLADGANTYLYGNGRIAQTGSTSEYFLGDTLGSVRQLADPNGAVTLTQSYAPYGEVTQSVGTSQANYAFTGEARDANGLTYLRARYLDSSTGRFTQRDPSRLEDNLYLYAGANPVNRVDPTGYFSNTAIARSLGVASFDDAIRWFRNYSGTVESLNDYPRWGFLRLLQEANIGDTLTGMYIGGFGVEHKIPLGKFECINGEIKIGAMSLESVMHSFDIKDSGYDNGSGSDIYWRSKIDSTAKRSN